MTRIELEKKIEDLEYENEYLKNLIRDYIPTKAEVEKACLEVLGKIDDSFIRGYYESACNYVLRQVGGKDK